MVGGLETFVFRYEEHLNQPGKSFEETKTKIKLKTRIRQSGNTGILFRVIRLL